VIASASKTLVTGCAGFLGSYLCEGLLARGDNVIGIDCFSDYYARSLKEANLAGLRGAQRFTLLEADLAECPLEPVLDGVDKVFHLAAQPGVRLSFGTGFSAYLRDNVQVTQRLLEAVAGRDLKAFVYASSSSVYGNQDVYPAREDAPLRPLSPYGATKVITEQLAGAFWRSAGIPVVGLRYFTVYGPRQRPDMASARRLAAACPTRASQEQPQRPGARMLPGPPDGSPTGSFMPRQRLGVHRPRDPADALRARRRPSPRRLPRPREPSVHRIVVLLPQGTLRVAQRVRDPRPGPG